MATTKVTFTLDDATLARLARAADRLRKPKSEVVRDAIEDFSARIGRTSEPERRRLLHAFDELLPKIPRRAQAAVDRELRELRKARRGGGRRSAPARP
jgi:flagellar motor switch protein FliG